MKWNYSVFIVPAMMLVNPAQAAASESKSRKVVDAVAKAARGCVTTRACMVTKEGRAFGAAVKSLDRAGYELGKAISVKKYGPAGNPGPYPGLRR